MIVLVLVLTLGLLLALVLVRVLVLIVLRVLVRVFVQTRRGLQAPRGARGASMRSPSGPRAPPGAAIGTSARATISVVTSASASTRRS